MTTLSIDPQITMRELELAYPGARRALFRRYHIGGCASCGFDPGETLASVCARNENLPVDEVMEHLQSSQEADEKMQITPRKLQETMESGGADLLLMDVRTREEYDAVHIAGATFFTGDRMQEMLSSVNREATLVFIDHKGERSMDAAAYFVGHGFASARSLRGGIDAWSQEIDPSLPRYDLE